MQVIIPKDEQEWLELRVKDVTSTEVGALFGISPYATPFELWHRKKAAVVVKFDPNERMEWGTALQEAIATKIAKDKGFKIRRMDEYIRDESIRAGSSFDFSIEEQNGLLEIKNVDFIVFRDEWTVDEDGAIQAPLHIEIQVQHELMVSNRDFCYIGVLIAGNNCEIIKRTRDESVIAAIKVKINKFWKSIEDNQPPDPNFQTDYEFLRTLYKNADPEKILNIVEDKYLNERAKEYKALADIIKDAEKKQEAISGEFLTKIGDASKVIGEGFSISCGMIAPCQMNYLRAGYRNFRFNWKKEKKA